MSNKILFLFLFLGVSSFSQESFSKTHFVGIELGPTFSTMQTTSTSIASSGKFGLCGGLAFEYGLRPRFSIKTGVYFERKGANLYPKFSYSYGFKEPLDLDYLILPVLVSFSNDVGMYVNVGPYVGFLSSEVEYKGIDLGGVLGVGVKFKFNQNSVFEIGIKETRGLTQRKNDSNFQFKNNSVNLFFGIKFNLWG